ncbi:MAG: hypothetical protein IPK80_10275 [Nannocystis sp.]|nr:hypothetical protein [Nannocystis sp.]
MKLCPACSRHLRDNPTTCPFCHTALSHGAPKLAALSLAAGLALAGCGDDGKSPGTDGTTDTSSSSSSTTQSTTETSGTTDATTDATTSTSTSTTDDSNGPVSAYGGPPADTITDGGRGQPAPDEDAPPSPFVAEPAPKPAK